MRICPCKSDKLDSESNSIMISDSESLGSSSNPFVIHCEECNFSTERLSVQLFFNTDTEIIYIQEFWNTVISNIDSDSSNEDLKIGFLALYPDFDKFLIDNLLSLGQLLDRDGRNTIVLIL